MVLEVKRGRPGIVPPSPTDTFAGLLQFGFQAGSWTLGAGSDISLLDNLEGTAARDASSVGTPPPQAVIEEGVDAILFPGTSTGPYFEFNGQGGGMTEGEMFIVHKCAADPQATDFDSGLHHIYTTLGAKFSQYTAPTGSLWEAFGFGAAHPMVNTGNPAPSLAVTHLYNVRINASGHLSLYFNGNNLHYSDTTARARDFSNAAMRWGRTSGATGRTSRWAGHGFELWCLHTQPTNGQRNRYLEYATYRYPALPALAPF